jgi:hypothetical protein
VLALRDDGEPHADAPGPERGLRVAGKNRQYYPDREEAKSVAAATSRNAGVSTRSLDVGSTVSVDLS